MEGDPVTYSLYPTPGIQSARITHRAYLISEFHDSTGRAEITAVLRPEYAGRGLPVLVCAATVDEVCAELETAGPPGLPRRDRKRRYIPARLR